jgi:diguanylate cyclase (GGDEF)-like protein/PAS domain S-box-containing protein
MAMDAPRDRFLISSHPSLATTAGARGTLVTRRIDPDPSEKVLTDARDRAEATLESIGDAVLCTDLAGKISYVNAAAEAMTGLARWNAVGRPVAEVLHLIDRETRIVAADPTRLAIALDRTVGFANGLVVRRDGHETEIEHTVGPIHDKKGRATGVVIVLRDVSASVETSRRMSHLAQHDGLTALPNRLLLIDRLGIAIALAHRRRKPLGVCFLDIDGFKHVNDSRGHAAGDALLRSIAARLSSTLRQSDTVSRFGGDEFVIVLSELERAEDAADVAAKLLTAIAVPHRTDAGDITVTASLGIALYPNHGEIVDTLIACADAAMYDAKRAGPGRYWIAGQSATAAAVAESARCQQL